MLETSLVQNRGVNNLTPRTFGYDFTVSSFEHPIDIQTPKLDSSIIWTQQNAENKKTTLRRLWPGCLANFHVSNYMILKS